MRVEQSFTIDAGIDRVWDVVYDLPNYKKWMAGLVRWEPEARKRKGLGARYNMRLKVGSVAVGSLIEIVECDPPCDLAWTSVTGLDQRGRWRLRELQGEGTQVTLRLSYQSPGGVLALVTDRALSCLVPTLFFGSAVIAYDVPPRATKSARYAIAFARMCLINVRRPSPIDATGLSGTKQAPRRPARARPP